MLGAPCRHREAASPSRGRETKGREIDNARLLVHQNWLFPPPGSSAENEPMITKGRAGGAGSRPFARANRSLAARFKNRRRRSHKPAALILHARNARVSHRTIIHSACPSRRFRPTIGAVGGACQRPAGSKETVPRTVADVPTPFDAREFGRLDDLEEGLPPARSPPAPSPGSSLARMISTGPISRRPGLRKEREGFHVVQHDRSRRD
jgi:hypothetical protein